MRIFTSKKKNDDDQAFNYGLSICKFLKVDSVTNKRGCLIYQTNRMVLTCTVWEIQTKLFCSGLSVSLGTTMSLKPYPTDKEITLCLCKLCLNKFDVDGTYNE